MKLRNSLLFLALGILFLGGCATGGTQGDMSSPKTSKFPNGLTPFTKFVDNDKKEKATGARFSNSYTRISITSDIKPQKDLSYNTHHLIYRYFLGSKIDINLSAKITVGGYSETIPLVTLSQQSTEDGQFWQRSIIHKRINFPLFLVKEDGASSVPNVEFALTGSKNYTSNMAGTALKVALDGIKLVSPQASVITKLNAQTTKNKAQAIDSAISKLFSVGINEKHISDREFRKWNTNGGVKISLFLPSSEKNWNDSAKNHVGDWTVTFDDPRPSIFSDWRICREGLVADQLTKKTLITAQKKKNNELRCKVNRPEAIKAVYKSINAHPEQILNYPLVYDGNNNNLGTIQNYLSQQKWYKAITTSFDSSSKVSIADKKNASNFCKNIANQITSIGLNGVDAKIVVWAVLKGMPDLNNLSQKELNGIRACYPPQGLTR